MVVRYIIAAGAAMIGTMTTPASAQAVSTATSPGYCRIEAIKPALDESVHIQSMVLDRTTDAQSTFCKVTGYIDQGSHIGFVLALPAKWNGKYLFIGVGGFAGAPGPIDAGVLRGYATASTDTGHKGKAIDDAQWALNNEGAVLNHFQRAVPLSVELTKAITAAYYGASPRHSYFDGCSGGGRQALLEVQQYPHHFDGVIAGAPAWNYSRLFLTMVENSQYLASHPKGWIPGEKFQAIDDEVLRQCDRADGLKDGMVADPRACTPNLKTLLCRPGASGSSCLNTDQVAALEFFSRKRSPAETAAGWMGMPLSGSEASSLGAGLSHWKFGPSPLVRGPDGRYDFPADALPYQSLGTAFLRNIYRKDPGFDYRTFNFAVEAEPLISQMAPLTNADNTDISPFVRRGGKLLLWHGWSDSAIPAEMSIDFYQRVFRDTRNSGDHPLDQSVRLFMVPGMQHCQWGSGLTEFDRITALERWVEQGFAPDVLPAEQVERGVVRRSRPICRFPKVARYRGVGDPDDVRNFECVDPKQ